MSRSHAPRRDAQLRSHPHGANAGQARLIVIEDVEDLPPGGDAYACGSWLWLMQGVLHVLPPPAE